MSAKRESHAREGARKRNAVIFFRVPFRARASRFAGNRGESEANAKRELCASGEVQ